MEISPLYEKKVECLCCKKTFATPKVRTKSVKVEHTDTDFCPTYADSTVNALYYNVFVCEYCGFSFTEDFVKYFAPGVRETIQEQISSRWVPRSYNRERTVFQALEAYKLAYFCGILKKEKSVSLAGLALRIGWIYRTLKNEDQEMRFIKIARDLYMTSYSTEDYAGTQMSDTRIMYMIAELSRRILDLDNATRFFSKVIENQRVGGEAKLVDMAKEQWQLVRELREKERAN
ncbi:MULTISPECIES: DUF2225 domain-containing protein [Lysinibacillus]|uniref:DUF2225 domain-containing protein n=1 Tax=Lysinibacillus antri TaxID=2498145 RepID=A0A3S0WE28_9BACI|nr:MULTISPECIES: DUF2225 domain-containing protein [Lysinibacillus]RUL46928.1 DUF2225 domain-containing protein [Lysinibacillus antri]TSI10465.1 DUF2225 domain-containing protein [Lysinibacillus sp. BW-2-10]